ncbi:MAG: Holliday junction resolvase RecU [Erysipelotrichaceae bacterium]|nr:Holliday junction resolvase RecU [Erysipelotrichaceae bacterium]
MINYPNKKVVNKQETNLLPAKKKQKVLNAANRGMDFEHAVSLSCQYYDEKQRAIITKRPTPIKIISADYKLAKITEAYFEKQSNTDYNGVYKGKYIDFECKETLSKTSLSFNNIPSHQIKHLKKVLMHGGIAFFMIYYKTLDEVYIVDANDIISLYENGDRKSITYEHTKEIGTLVEQGFIPRLKFLDAVDKVYFNENTKENY